MTARSVSLLIAAAVAAAACADQPLPSAAPDPAPRFAFECPTWSPDGKSIAFTRTGSFIDL